ncbi:DUF6221 family protein [Streptomyces sp. NPDC059916]|uniref:DUF6221 family protein n=1 Tax=Streptomyces sp. NPDC059916 TaxID=3347001 RepID=UPI0036D115ED
MANRTPPQELARRIQAETMERVLVTVAEWDATPGLHEWIEQKIAEVERVLRNLDKEHGRGWTTRWDARTDSFQIVDGSGRLVAESIQPGSASFIALSSPAAVQRRCTADRKILAAHPYTAEALNPGYGPHTAGFGCETCHDWDGATEGRGNCETILALAEAYGLDEAGEENVEVVRD